MANRPKNFDHNPDGTPGFGLRDYVRPKPKRYPKGQRLDEYAKPIRDWGYELPSGLERFITEERKARPWAHFKAAYTSLIGENPDAGPCDMKTARTRLWLINRALEQGNWTKSEWAKLYKMRDKWKIRVEGHDPRYTIRGNKSGPPTREQRGYIELHRALARVLKLHEKRMEKSEA